jgi:DNA-binding CsgD family transcriptional regulator
MAVSEYLRPLERRILDLRGDGLSVEEIAGRFKRSPAHVERIISWTEIPRSRPPVSRNPRPIEARVLALRGEGESHEQIATRFKRGPRSIRQIEGIAHFKLAHELLGSETQT